MAEPPTRARTPMPYDVATSASPEPGTPGAGDELDAGEFRRRASGGLFVVAGWSSFNLLLGFGGNIALARLLVPRDFGVFAIGATVLLFVNALSDGGLTAGLIRRPEPPSRRELRNVVALHLLLTVPVAAAALVIAPRFGAVGTAVAIMLLGLPLGAFQSPGRLMFTRALLFQRVSVAEASGTLAFYVWAIAGSAAGYGVWALATGAVVRVVVSVATTVALSPHRLVLPTLRGAQTLVPVFKFGLSFQSTYIAKVVRDQLLNVVVGVLGGLTGLGLWSFTYRLMQGPMVLFDSVWRVSFPAMSRLLAEKRDASGIIERSLGVSGTAAALFVGGIGAAAPELVPAVFGEQWRPAASIVVGACLAVMIWGPVSVSTVGFLFAAGRPSTVLGAGVAQAVVWIGIAAALVPVIGVAGLGVGWVVGGLVDAALLGRAVSRLTGARTFASVAPPVAVGVAAMAAGLAVTQLGPPGLLSGIAGGAAAVAAFVAALFVVRRQLLVATFGFALESVSSAFRRRAGGADAPSPAS